MSEEQGEGADRHRLKTTFASKIRKGAGEKGKHVGGTVCRGNEITGMLQRDRVVGQHAVIMGGTAVEKQCAKRQAKSFDITQRMAFAMQQQAEERRAHTGARIEPNHGVA